MFYQIGKKLAWKVFVGGREMYSAK